MAGPIILALDAGTTSVRTIAFDLSGEVVAQAGRPVSQVYPNPGWVEHDLSEIWAGALASLQDVWAALGARSSDVEALGITNQRETIGIWDSGSGQPLANAIVWQDRRVAEALEPLRARGLETEVQQRTGLVLDPYFSAAKLAWLLDHVPGARESARRGEVRAGTVDSYLVWQLTGGAHITDATNASRTQLMGLREPGWNSGLADLFRVPMACLPDIVDSSGLLGEVRADLLGRTLPICGIAGDQQAAAIGQACLHAGQVKSTYGTGCFVLANVGHAPVHSAHRLLSTVAWQSSGERHYALEGSIFVAGSLIQWLRDSLGLITSAAETEELAGSVANTSGVYVVPALAGLGAPHWRPEARGLICGLTGGAGRAHVVRAALEAMSYQTNDLLTAFRTDGVDAQTLRIDGGMAANDWLAQDLADITGLAVERPASTEATAWGAAMLAAVGCGAVASLEALATGWQAQARFTPALDAPRRARRLAGWNDALARCMATDPS